MTRHSEQPTHRVAFVCVQNAGRSQMAAALAERERARRDAADRIEIVTGGTRPADRVHDVVVEAMAELDIDLSDRTPREVTPDELRAMDLVVTMGCSASDVCPAAWNGESRDWGLDDPDDKPLEAVRAIRDEIDDRVAALFDELVSETPSAE
ncbi:low molecular weight phosphatase family protein [Halorubrum sp. SD626R]|uniref:arsenate reductase/protein-tyrosine-phosphatase family protein n=1 Tax=Halorubrum sp. SD626R TaxID=1419722 RepID=UPI0010F52ECA|nr:low molecular weight phosphatase family protein [Halorubrum sp. SD626R]TKX79288.1 low molecular weight phosphatase family protein [Halorubrum sp. SD626R]